MLLSRINTELRTPTESAFLALPPLQATLGLRFTFTKTNDSGTQLAVMADANRWPLWHVSCTGQRMLWHSPSVTLPLPETDSWRVAVDLCDGCASIHVNEQRISQSACRVPRYVSIGSSPYLNGTRVYGGAVIFDIEIQTEPYFEETTTAPPEEYGAPDLRAIREMEAELAEMGDPALLDIDIDRLTFHVEQNNWALGGPEPSRVVLDVYTEVNKHLPGTRLAHFKSGMNDELLVICAREDAEILARRVCRAVAEKPMGGLPPGAITVSIGVGCGSRRLPVLLAQAGTARAEAKQQGRNRVCVRAV